MATKSDEKKLDRIKELLPKLSNNEWGDIERAYYFAKEAHKNQKRASGAPYFSHVYNTAHYLAELGMDSTTIIAGFIHDTIEDTDVTDKDVEETFGKEVLFLVQGVTKLGKLKYQGLKRHIESLRKLFVAVAEDVRVLIIRLADRQHNMRTLSYIPKEKQKRIALETLEIYAPLAHRLGMGQLKGELEDYAFLYLFPEEYAQTEELVKKKSKENIARLKKISRTLLRLLAENKIKSVQTDYRIKHLYSLYRKLQNHDMNIEKVYDLAALRIIVPSVDDCYKTFGIVHKRWRPLPGRIKDYIASPKINGYQSLHTTIFTGDGGIVEIQIRTPQMHEEAEHGIASHVAYKEGDSSSIWTRWFKNTQTKTSGKIQAPWLKEIVALQENVTRPQDFLGNLKNDFFDDRVFVFTPKGDVIDLPTGATPVDLAYAVHTDIGSHIAGAKINGKLASLDTPLTSGDIVDIQTRVSSKPTRKWLEYAKTTLARRRIRNALAKN